jgi:polyphosphate kinase
MKDVLDARKQSYCVRLEISRDVTKTMLNFLYKALKIDNSSTYKIDGPLNFNDLFAIAGIKGYESLKLDEWTPQPSPDFRPGERVFDTLTRKDVVLVHPYEQYDPVVRLVEEAADDPDVLAIKQILYRTSKDSPIITALIRAAEKGKSVTAFVELKARFDEAQNIKRAQELEQAGAQVIYGVQHLKTHAKLCFVVRKEPNGIRRYVHFGTGNYNESTAKLYSDISYMTCRDDYGVDASAFFNTITGYSQPMNYHYLHAAPLTLKPRILSMIDSEIQRRKSGQKALVMAKVNSLVDLDVVEKLYEASQAGVKILLNIRGICCLRPGIKGLSDNIKVTSIIDRYLEHARIFYFHNGGEPDVLISSADWMPRNLIRRVELLVPVQDDACKKRLISLLETYFADNTKARTVYSDGTYAVERKKGKRRIQAQRLLYHDAVRAIELAKDVRLQHFETHKPG